VPTSFVAVSGAAYHRVPLKSVPSDPTRIRFVSGVIVAPCAHFAVRANVAETPVAPRLVTSYTPEFAALTTSVVMVPAGMMNLSPTASVTPSCASRRRPFAVSVRTPFANVPAGKLVATARTVSSAVAAGSGSWFARYTLGSIRSLTFPSARTCAT
jgi:hypothetical protein